MMTEVMMFGGHRDGEILVVPGDADPISFVVRLTMKEKFNSFSDEPIFSESNKRYIDLHIVPRKASSGPLWKIELPKELW